MSGDTIGIEIGTACSAVDGCVGLEDEIMGLRDRVSGALDKVGCLGEHGGVLDGFEEIRGQSETARLKLTTAVAGLLGADSGWSIEAVLALLGPSAQASLASYLTAADIEANPHLAELLQEMRDSLDPGLYNKWYEEYSELITAAPNMTPQELGAELNQAYTDGDKAKIEILTAAVWDDLDGKDEEYTKLYLGDMGVAFESHTAAGGNVGYGFTHEQALFMLVAAGGIPNNDYIFGKSQSLANWFASYGYGTPMPNSIRNVLEMYDCMPLQSEGGGTEDLMNMLEPLQTVLANDLIDYYDRYVPDSQTKNIDILKKYADGDFFGEWGSANRPLARLMSMYALDDPYSFLNSFAADEEEQALKFAKYLNDNLPTEEVEVFFGGLYAWSVDRWGLENYQIPFEGKDLLAGLRNFMEAVEVQEGIDIGWGNVLAAAKIILSAAEYIPGVGTAAKLIRKGIVAGSDLSDVLGLGDEEFRTRLEKAAERDYGDELDRTLALMLLESRDQALGGSGVAAILEVAGVDSVEEMTPEAWANVKALDPNKPIPPYVDVDLETILECQEAMSELEAIEDELKKT